MKKTIIVILTALTLTFVGCSGGGAGNGNSGDPSGGGNYAKELWGEWIRMDTGDRWYISDEAVKINGSPAAVTAELTKESERVVAVKDGGRNYWLYAARAATASFTGVIVGDAGTGSARAMGGGLGGINVAVANLANQANRLTTTTDHEGVFVARGVIPGDSYLVTPESGKPVTVTPSGDGDDIGVVTVTSGVNFKTSIAPASASTDMNELYMNEWYGFDLTFENVGTEDCPAPSYAVTAPDGVTIGGDLQGILGTIEPDAKKSVRIDALCYAIDGDYQYKNISVTIKDATGKKWEDSVSLRFYRESITFNVRAERPTSGVVITPDAKTYSFTDTTDGSVTAPLRRTGDYLVVFSGATIDTETSYALGVGAAAAGDFGSFTDTSRYEPNNTEGAAAALGEPRIMAYLHKNDIDYYRVSYGNLGFLPAPTNATASVADAQVTLSWTGVAGAVSYNVYRSGSQTGTYTKVGETATASYADTVSATGTYYYTISAVGANGFEGARSSPAAATVAGPPAPTNATASVADAQVTLSWTGVAGAVSYNVYRSGSQTGTYTKVGETATASYADTVSARGMYYYRISATSASGWESERSPFVTAAVAGPPAPTNATASVADAQVTVSWTEVAGAVSYNVYRLVSPTGTYTKVGESATASYVDTVNAAGTYYYEISAVGAGGLEGSPSASARATVAAIPIDAASLSAALAWVSANAVEGGDYSYTLIRDESLAPTSLSYSGKNVGVTLIGGDAERTVSLSSNGSLFTIGSGVTLTLGESVTLRGRSSNSASLVQVNGGGTLVTTDGSKITGNAVASSSFAYGGGVYVYGGGTFTMSGGEVSGNTASSSSSYSCESYGGGVYVYSGTFTMSGGEISGNSATGSGGGGGGGGGGVYVSSTVTFTMTGGEVSDNSATWGGGIYVGGVTFTMSGGIISGNTAAAGGGVYMDNGMYAGNGTFTMSGGEISGNSATGSGGGMFVDDGTFTMSGGSISGNSATGNGGGMSVSSGTFTMSGGAISGNSVTAPTARGGGVFVSAVGTFTKQSGGVVYGSNGGSLQNRASQGSAAFVYKGGGDYWRNSTAGAGVDMDSAKSGAAGGWER